MNAGLKGKKLISQYCVLGLKRPWCRLWWGCS